MYTGRKEVGQVNEMPALLLHGDARLPPLRRGPVGAARVRRPRMHLHRRAQLL